MFVSYWNLKSDIQRIEQEAKVKPCSSTHLKEITLFALKILSFLTVIFPLVCLFGYFCQRKIEKQTHVDKSNPDLLLDDNQGFISKDQAARKLQSLYRGHLGRKTAKKMKKNVEQAAIKIQRILRSRSAQKESLAHKAAVKIQSVIRTKRAQQKSHALKKVSQDVRCVKVEEKVIDKESEIPSTYDYTNEVIEKIKTKGYLNRWTKSAFELFHRENKIKAKLDDNIKFHISLKRTKYNFEKAIECILPVLDEYEISSFKILSPHVQAQARYKKKRNIKGKEFCVYIQPKNHKNFQEIVRKISYTLLEAEIETGVRSQGDILIPGTTHMYLRNAYNEFGEYVPASDFCFNGFTARERALISCNPIYGLDRDVLLSDHSLDFSHLINLEEKEEADKMCIFSPNLDLFLNSTTREHRWIQIGYIFSQYEKWSFCETKSYTEFIKKVKVAFMKIHPGKDPSNITPAFYYSFVVPFIGRLNEAYKDNRIIPSIAEEINEKLEDHLIKNETKIFNYFLSCACRSNSDDQRESEKPIYRDGTRNALQTLQVKSPENSA